MNNLVSIPFLAVLLSLCGFFFLLSVHSQNETVDLIKTEKFRGVCCLGCNALNVELLQSGEIQFEGQIISKYKLKEHLEIHALYNRVVPLINITTAYDTNTQRVVTLTDYLKKQLPDHLVSWSVGNST